MRPPSHPHPRRPGPPSGLAPAAARAAARPGSPRALRALRLPARLAPVAAFALLLLAGCAGYQLGPSNGLAPGEKSIEILPFANRTLEPRLTDAVTTQLRKEIMRDGTFRLHSSGDADILVRGALLDYDRREVTVESSDTLTVRDYFITLTAEVTAIDRTSGRNLLQQRVEGHTLIRVGNDLVSSERQALPLLAQDLARNLTYLLADGSW